MPEYEFSLTRIDSVLMQENTTQREPVLWHNLPNEFFCFFKDSLLNTKLSIIEICSKIHY